MELTHIDFTKEKDISNRIRGILWENRNEPQLVLLVAVLLLALLFVFGYQIIYRQAPIYSNGVLLPARAEAVTGIWPSAYVPIGTIVAYFGRDDDIPKGWALCDGQNVPDGARINMDADKVQGGKQLPDLRSRFIRGSHVELNSNEVRYGGSDTRSLLHAHMWAHFKRNNQWFSHNEHNTLVRVDVWNNGLDDKGEGDFPLLVAQDRELYTSQSGSSEISNLPSYVELRFIIRVF